MTGSIPAYILSSIEKGKQEIDSLAAQAAAEELKERNAKKERMANGWEETIKRVSASVPVWAQPMIENPVDFLDDYPTQSTGRLVIHTPVGSILAEEKRVHGHVDARGNESGFGWRVCFYIGSPYANGFDQTQEMATFEQALAETYRERREYDEWLVTEEMEAKNKREDRTMNQSPLPVDHLIAIAKEHLVTAQKKPIDRTNAAIAQAAALIAIAELLKSVVEPMANGEHVINTFIMNKR